MGSIPLAANNLRVPEQPNALEQYARIVQLQQQQKLMPGQLQQQQQQIQAGQQENQVRGQQIKDQQSMTAAMQEWDGKDLNQLPGLMLKHGASAQAVMSTKTGIIKQQQDLANLSKDQLANEKTKNDYFVQALDNVKQLPPEQQPQGFQAAVQDAVQKGHLDPQMAQGLQYQGPQQLDVLEKTLMGHNAVLEQALKGAETSKNTAQAGMDTANTAKIQAELNFYKKQGLAPGVPLDAQEAADWMQKNPGKGPAEFMKMKAALVPQMNFNLQNAGATGAPGQPSSIAKGIADGSIKWNDAVSARTPMNVKQALLSEVKSINPAFKSSDFDVEKKVQENFTSGNYSQQLNSINRAREHMQTFLETAKDLDGGNVKAFNRLGNAFSVEFGSDKVGNLNIAKQAFSSEVGKAFAGASVGVTDRQELDHQINAASSFGQLSGAAKTADRLLAGAQKALKETYGSGMQGKPNFGNQPEAPKGMIQARDPQGKLHQAPAGTALPAGWKLEQ